MLAGQKLILEIIGWALEVYDNDPEWDAVDAEAVPDLLDNSC